MFLPSCFLKEAGLHALGDIMDSLFQLLDDSLALQCLNCERVCLCRCDDERYNGRCRVGGLEFLVQAYRCNIAVYNRSISL